MWRAGLSGSPPPPQLDEEGRMHFIPLREERRYA